MAGVILTNNCVAILSDILELEPREAQPFTRETTQAYTHVMQKPGVGLRVLWIRCEVLPREQKNSYAFKWRKHAAHIILHALMIKATELDSGTTAEATNSTSSVADQRLG